MPQNINLGNHLGFAKQKFKPLKLNTLKVCRSILHTYIYYIFVYGLCMVIKLYRNKTIYVQCSVFVYSICLKSFNSHAVMMTVMILDQEGYLH